MTGRAFSGCLKVCLAVLGTVEVAKGQSHRTSLGAAHEEDRQGRAVQRRARRGCHAGRGGTSRRLIAVDSIYSTYGAPVGGIAIYTSSNCASTPAFYEKGTMFSFGAQYAFPMKSYLLTLQ